LQAVVTRRTLSRRIAAACVGGALLLICGIYIARTFRWREVATLLLGANLNWFLIGSSAAIVAFWLVRAFRWRFLLQGMQSEIGFVDLYLCSSVALSLSVFTPFQSGEALKIELLRKYGGVARFPGYGAFTLERAADLYAVIAMGIVALALPAATPALIALLLGILIFLPIAAYLILHNLRFAGRMGEFVAHLQSGIGTPSMLFVLLLSTFLSWAMVALGWQACLRSLSIGLDLAELLGLVSLVTLASVASFIPGGLGVAEAGAAEVLIGYGVSAPHAQSGALMLRAFSLLVILLGAIHWLLLHVTRKYPR
jgi:uncharacterized membrane protein YbhN (UPF0104 family)